jgi:hypothetical protein
MRFYEYPQTPKRNTRSFRPTRALMTARARFTACQDDEFEKDYANIKTALENLESLTGFPVIRHI